MLSSRFPSSYNVLFRLFEYYIKILKILATDTQSLEAVYYFEEFRVLDARRMCDHEERVC